MVEITVLPQGRPAAVYRLYDHAGRALYIGMTSAASARMYAHRNGPFGPEIAGVDWEHFPNRAQAKRREKELIAAERPKHNRRVYVIRTAAEGAALCPLCLLEGVNEPATRRGWCERHYRRQTRNGDAAYEPKPLRTCSANATCGRVAVKRGWCIRHYRAWQTYGDPNVKLNMRGEPAEQRFWTHVDKAAVTHPTLGPCWIWTGSLSNGYGRFSTGGRGKNGGAHCFAYQLLVGPVPDGLELDHLCRNPACVNPRHLEPVTKGENSRRRWKRNGGRYRLSHEAD